MTLFSRACVASPHHLASAEGAKVLRAGGNALDAAIATNLVLGVVAPYLCGYGGDLFAIVWSDGLHGYNGSGRAPKLATTDEVRRATAGDSIPERGPHSVTVPGAVEAWFALLERFGTRSFADLAAPARRYADEGFALSAKGRASIAAAAHLFADEREWSSIYARAGKEGFLRQASLAGTIALLSDDGPQAFYEREIADALASHLADRGGLMRGEDLAAHSGEWVAPVVMSWRGTEIAELPPNSQGVIALEALAIVGEEDLPPDPGEREHLLVEAMKLALADRDAHLGDPEHMELDPAELLSERWIESRRSGIDPERASAPLPGRPARGGTAYMCAADADGMFVSLIQSNYMGFGSGVTVPGYGVNLHNRGAYFSLERGHPNSIAPRKRPLHTLMPGLLADDEGPVVAFGAMGGDGQAQTHLQLLVRLLVDGAPVGAAVAAPRWIVTPGLREVVAEDRFDPAIVEGLRARGHEVTLPGPFEDLMGHAHVVRRTGAGNGFEAAADPRSEGSAEGF